MTIIRIDRSRGGWESVPRRLFDDARLCLDTRGVAGFLATRTESFRLSASGLRKLLKLGKEKYERIARELETAGYLQRKQSRDSRGRLTWELIFRPEPIGGFPTQKGKIRDPKQAVQPPMVGPPEAQPPAVEEGTTGELGEQETLIQEHHHQSSKKTVTGGGVPELWEMTADFELAQACLSHEIINKAGYRRSILDRYRREGGPACITISEMDAAKRRSVNQSEKEQLEREKHEGVIQREQENNSRREAIWCRILQLGVEERKALYFSFMKARPDLSILINKVSDEFISSGLLTRPLVKIALIEFAASHL